MTRSQVFLRDAVRADAGALAELWVEVLRRSDHVDQVVDLELIIDRIALLPEERIVVAEYDGQLAGAVHLRVTTLSPLNLEQIVQTVSPHVLPQFRRRGIGRALMEAAVSFAEEQGVAHVAAGATAGSRDANRFLARLALGPYAVYRVAPTMVVKAKLSAQRPALGRTHGGKQLTQVLAARRSLRRSEPTPS